MFDNSTRPFIPVRVLLLPFPHLSLRGEERGGGGDEYKLDFYLPWREIKLTLLVVTAVSLVNRNRLPFIGLLLTLKLP